MKLGHFTIVTELVIFYINGSRYCAIKIVLFLLLICFSLPLHRKKHHYHYLYNDDDSKSACMYIYSMVIAVLQYILSVCRYIYFMIITVLQYMLSIYRYIYSMVITMQYFISTCRYLSTLLSSWRCSDIISVYSYMYSMVIVMLQYIMSTCRYIYSMVIMVLQYFLPLFVLTFTYTWIGIIIWGKKTPGEAQNARDQRMAASKRKVSVDQISTMMRY